VVEDVVSVVEVLSAMTKPLSFVTSMLCG